LGVLDPPGRAGVLALHPDRGLALLEVPGLVYHQDRIGVTQGSASAYVGDLWHGWPFTYLAVLRRNQHVRPRQ
jgi:hypothetical protein